MRLSSANFGAADVRVPEGHGSSWSEGETMGHQGSATRSANVLAGWGCLFACLVCNLAGPALSQELPRGESVYQRARPDYDPLGIHLGGFFAYPSLGIGEAYQSNIFAEQNNTKSDFITVLEPNIDINSNWGLHALDFSAGATASLFAEHTTENTVDGHVRLTGRYDVDDATNLNGGVSWDHLHES